MSRAARILGLPKSSASRRIQMMEAALHVQLLHRTTRTTQPTETGRAFFERCQRILEEVNLAEQLANEESGSARGKLRIALPSTVGVPYFSRWVTEFMAQHPEVELEIDTGAGERPVDFVKGNYDAWLKIGPAPDSGVTVRPLGWLSQSVYASPGYLVQHPAPGTPEALSDHNCLAAGAQPYLQGPWCLLRGRQRLQVPVKGNTWVNNLGMLRFLALDGLGIACMPDAYVRQDVADGGLVRLLPDWQAQPLELNLVIPQRAILPARTRLLVAFLTSRVPALTEVGPPPLPPV